MFQSKHTCFEMATDTVRFVSMFEAGYVPITASSGCFQVSV